MNKFEVGKRYLISFKPNPINETFLNPSLIYDGICIRVTSSFLLIKTKNPLTIQSGSHNKNGSYRTEDTSTSNAWFLMSDIQTSEMIADDLEQTGHERNIISVEKSIGNGLGFQGKVVDFPQSEV